MVITKNEGAKTRICRVRFRVNSYPILKDFGSISLQAQIRTEIMNQHTRVVFGNYLNISKWHFFNYLNQLTINNEAVVE